jgi:hypothetical protein
MRSAIAMVELIFAIVIMGIVLMSAPLLVSTATESGYVAIQQESINEATSQVNMILGHSWDEQNTDESLRAIILATTNGDSNLSEINATDGTINIKSGRRAGTPTSSYRRFTRSDGSRANASAIGSDGEATEDDIDDFNGTTTHLYEAQAVTNRFEDYIEVGTDINITREVTYTSDLPVAADGSYYDPGGDNNITFNFSPTGVTASTNIKGVKVTLTSVSNADELKKTIILHAFSCNIGSYELEER